MYCCILEKDQVDLWMLLQKYQLYKEGKPCFVHQEQVSHILGSFLKLLADCVWPGAFLEIQPGGVWGIDYLIILFPGFIIIRQRYPSRPF